MTLTKKFGFGAIATALFAVLGMATLVNTAYAAHSFDSPSTATAGSTITLTVTGLAGGGETVIFERLASSEATGFFLSNNNATTLQCVNGAACDTDGADDNGMTVQFFVSANSPAGSLAFSATQGGDSETDTTTVSASAGTATSLVLTGPSTLTNGGAGSDYTVYATNASGGRVAVAGVTVNVSSRGLLAQTAGSACLTIAANTAGAEVTGDDDTSCTAATVTSSASPTKVGVRENGAAGDTITVSAFVTPAGATAPIVASMTVTIAGDASAATMGLPTESVAAGSTSQVTINVTDSAGRPAGPTNVTAAASAGVIVCPVETGQTQAQTTSGLLTCTFVAPATAQNVVITAVVDKPNSAEDIIVTGTLNVTGSATPGTPGETGDGTFASAPNFGSGNVGSAVFNGGSIADLADAVTDAGGTAVWVQGTDGNWYRYNTLATGATAFVNNAFEAQFSAGFGVTAVFVVK